jgi:hypothetical protein
MPGLVPGIHAQKPSTTSKVVCVGAAWMAGTSPAMTSKDGEQPDCISDSVTLRFPRTALCKAGRSGARSATDEGRREPLKIFVVFCIFLKRHRCGKIDACKSW